MAMINVSIAQNENLVPNIKKKIVKATDGEKTINRTEAKYKRIFVISDLHAPYCHPEALEFIKKINKYYQC